MSIEANPTGRMAADAATREDWRRAEVSKSLTLIGELLSNRLKPPYNILGHFVDITDVRQDHAVDGTYLVLHAFEHQEKGQEKPHKYEERFVLSAARTALTGHSKLDLTSYEDNEEYYIGLGMRRSTEGLNEEEEELFAIARDEYTTQKAERVGIPQAALSDAEQASMASSLNDALVLVHNAVVTNRRHSSFAPV